jgi:rare lipoprotein A
VKFFLIIFFNFFCCYTIGQNKGGVFLKDVKSPGKEFSKTGMASYYSNQLHGAITASGERYHHSDYTAACNLVPINTYLKVTNLSNHKWVIVKVNDRLHRKNKRVIDVSQFVARKLGFLSKGIAKVKIEKWIE